jgi:hypothetical protein
MAFLDLLPVGRVVDRIVNISPEIENGLRVRGFSMRLSIDMTIQCLGSSADFSTESSVRAVHSGNVRRHRKRAVNFGVFRVEFRLVKVIGIVHVGSMDG